MMRTYPELIRALGITIFHSLWEGLVVFLLVILALALIPRQNARYRYILLVFSLFVLTAGFLTTLMVVYRHTILSLHPVPLPGYIPYSLPEWAHPALLRLKENPLQPAYQSWLNNLYPLAAFGWILGFLLMAIKTTGGIIWSYRISHQLIMMPDPSLLAVFERTKSRLSVTRPLHLRLSMRQISPMVVGFIKPCVLIPLSMLSGLSPRQVEAVLLHELAHIKRYDHYILIFQTLAHQLLFFHPLVWWLSREISLERENCCDDLVLKSFPDPIIYIKALTMIQELNMTGPVPVNALTGKPKLLLNRVKRLLKHESGNRSVFKPALLLIVFIVFGAALVAVAATGNAKKRQPQHTLTLMINPAQTAGPDTTLKTVKHPQKKDRVAAKKEHEEQKRLDEANLKLEKARQDLEKAQEEVDQASMEVYKERGKIDPQSGATDMEAYQRAMEKSKELMERDKLFQFKMQDEMKHAQEDMKRSHEDQMRSQRDWVLLYSQISREDMEKYRQEWEKYREEWRKAAEQMRKQMQEFYQQHRDSLKLFFPEGPDALVAPVPPVSPLFHLAVPVSPKQPFDLKYLLVIPSDSINSRDVEDSLPSKLKSVEE